MPFSGVQILFGTTGFNDTEGIEQDACNLACIHDMLKNHRPLQSLSGKDDAKVSQHTCHSQHLPGYVYLC